MPDTQDAITTAQAAAILGVSHAAIVQWGDTGKLRSYRTLGGHRRFSRSQCEALAAEQAARLAAS